MKILESNKVLQSVFSGMAINYLNTEYQNGYIRDIYNECKVVMNSSNSITVSTGMIVVEGIRLLFDEAETFNITSFPDSSLLHHLVLKVTATTEGENKAEIINRINEPLRQDEILKTGSGVYELELASYLLSPNGISNFAQTLLPIILTNEELQSFKEMIDELDKKVDALDQVIITANEDAERALTTVSNLTVGTVQKGTDPAASIDVDVIKMTAKLNLTLPKGDKGDNGTVVKINGEPQGTWDATISQKISDESANIIDTEDNFGVFEGVEYKTINNKTILNGTATYSGNIWIKIKKPIKAGTIFSFNQFTNDENLKKGVIWLGKAINDWDNRIQVQDGRANISVNYDINYISIYVANGTNYSLSHITPMAVLGKVKPTTYFEYNPNRHITNSEAEFLREEHNKTINEFDKNNLNLIGYGYIGTSTRMIIYTADVPVYYVECKPNVTYTISKKAGKYFRVATFDKIPEIDKTVGLQAIRDDEGTSITITTDSNAKYLVFNIYSSTSDTITLQEMLDTVQIEKDSVATPYQSYNAKMHITNSQADFLKDKFENQVNIFNPINIVNGSLGSGILYIGATNRLVKKDYIPLKPNTTYTISAKGVNNLSVHLYDSNQIFISQPGWKTSPYTFTTPSNATLGRVCFRNSDDSDISVSVLTEVMLNEGGLLSYTSYNSSSHIDNDVTNLLISEYEKSANLYKNSTKPWTISVSSVSNLTYSETGITFQIAKGETSSTGVYLPASVLTNKFGLEVGKKYTYIIDYELSNTNAVSIRIEWGNKSNTKSSSTKGRLKVSQIHNGSSALTIYINETGFTSDLPKVTITNIMILEGDVSTANSYKWHGKIAHMEDIKNFSFDESTGTLSITDN